MFYRGSPGFRGCFYQIWPCGAYELSVFAAEDVAWLYLNAMHVDDGISPAEVARTATPITRAEYESQVTRCLEWPRGGVLARPVAQDRELAAWRNRRL